MSRNNIGKVCKVFNAANHYQIKDYCPKNGGMYLVRAVKFSSDGLVLGWVEVNRVHIIL